MRTPARIGVAALLLLALLGLLLSEALAATQAQPDPKDKFRSGGNITISEDVPHDLYVMGGRVTVEGAIDGDLVAMGGQVEVDGPVRGDLWIAGGSVTVRGQVDGDLRATGGTVQVEGTVQEDLLAGAGTLSLESGSRVGGDLIFGAGNAMLEGTVDGSVLGSAGRYSTDGTIAGSEDVSLDRDEGPTLAERLIDQVRRYITIILLALLMLWLMPRLFGAATRLLRERPLPTGGVGLLTGVLYAVALLVILIASVVAAIVLGSSGFGGLLATVIAALLLVGAVLTFLMLVAGFYLADAVVGQVIGRLLLGRAEGGWAGQPIWALLIGVLIVVVLTALPFIGGVLQAIAGILGVGALVWALWRRRGEAAMATTQP
jgi:cytoskeletal protein CcmA (bactofilin family)